MPRGIEWALAMLAKQERALRQLAAASMQTTHGRQAIVNEASLVSLADNLNQVQDALALPAPEDER